MADPISWIAAKAAEWVAMTAFQLASATGVSVTTAATIANVAYFATQGLVYAGAFAVGAALTAPRLPSAEQGQVPVNQTTPRRRMGTGRARLSGPRLMWESIPGWNIEIMAVHEGAVDGFEQIYLNDDKVTVDAQGWVQVVGQYRYGDGNAVRVLTKTGQPGVDDGPFEEIVALCAAAGLPDLYGQDHRADGIARIALLCKAVEDKDVQNVYPNGPPSLSAVTRLSRVYDWRDPAQSLMDPRTWKWSANAHVNHVHWEWCLRHLPVEVDAPQGRRGWRQGDGSPPPPVCLEAWHADIAPRLADCTAAANLCDEAVPLKAGGSEPRYSQGGWWEIGTEDADIRRQYLACYDGWMAEGGDGALSIRGGVYAPADVALTDRNITEANWNRGAPGRQTYNILQANFTSPEHGWTTQQAQDWRDEGGVSRLGEKPTTLDLGWVQSHGQARRLMKRHAARAFAVRHGDLAADLAGLGHVTDRYLRIERSRGPTSMRSVVCELVGASIDLTAGKVAMSVVLADPLIDSWDPLAEEGDGPAVEGRAPAVELPTPVIVSALPFPTSSGVRVQVEVENPMRPALAYLLRWKVRDGTFLSWVTERPEPILTSGGTIQLNTSALPFGSTIDIEVAFVASSPGPYASVVVETPEASVFSVQASARSVTGHAAGGGVITTDAVSVSYSGNSGNVSIEWDNVGGAVGAYALDDDDLLTSFRHTIAAGEEASATFQATLTDAGTGQVRTLIVGAVFADSAA